jgi:hypothetical protein
MTAQRTEFGDEGLSLRVGYVPNARDMNGPADRRRLCYYAKKRGMELEFAEPGVAYDLVVLSAQADLSVWSHRPLGARRIVFDMPDSYLSQHMCLPELIKAPAKYLTGQWSNFEPSFGRAVRRMCSVADAVICSTPEQREMLLRYNSTVTDILDFHFGELSCEKTDYAAHKPFRVVWEGVGNSLYGLSRAASALRRVSQDHPLELHVITDLRYRRMNSPFGGECARKNVSRFLPGVKSYLYEWNTAFFSDIATGCDLAIIPTDVSVPMIEAKPENRLILFWRMGLPVLTSRTSAYARVMTKAGINGTCSDPDEWYRSLSQYVCDEATRKKNVGSGRHYATENCSEALLLQRWDELFGTVLGS